MCLQASVTPVRALADILALHPLAEVAWRAASEAAAFLHTQRPDDLGFDTKSSPTDVVTTMDVAAEQMLQERLMGERPQDGLLGEEGAVTDGTSGYRWVVDPLDGTVNYLYRIPLWGVSVAVEDLRIGGSDLGVVITPESGEGFIGIRGRGSWMIAGDSVQRLSVRDCDDVNQAMVSTGFAYGAALRRSQGNVLAGLIESVRDIRRSGCAVVDFTWLARGRTDAYFERGLNPWDVAAGSLIAREAGAVVRELAAQDGPATMMAAVPAIADDLERLLQTSR